MICGYVRVCAGISQPRGKNCQCAKKGKGAETSPHNPAHTRNLNIQRIRREGYSVRKIKQGWYVRAGTFAQIMSDDDLPNFGGVA